MPTIVAVPKADQNRALGLSTFAFTICFAVWTIFAIIGIQIKAELGLNDTQFGLLVGTPILTGSLIRVFLGVWTDQHGGRIVFPATMLASAASTFLLSYAHTYPLILAAALGVGLAGGGFAVGIAYVSKWYPQEKQGTALGFFGMGNVGAAVTKFAAPFIMVALGWTAVAQIWAAALAVIAVLFFLFSKDDPDFANRKISGAKPKSLREQLEPLKFQQVWRFSLYYFFVFGAFVALALWLPKYLMGVYGVDVKTAGMFAATFSLSASLFRAYGGILSDRYGARKIMYVTFGVSLVCLFMLSYPATDYVIHGIKGDIRFSTSMSLLPFVLTMFLLGFVMSLGKAAVYKHIPVYYPDHVGAVGGMVGMVGGLGGFILPIIFGAVSDLTGVWTSCFMVLFALVAVAFGWMHLAVRQMEQKASGIDARSLPQFPEMADLHDTKLHGAGVAKVIAEWRPEDREFWENIGEPIARRNLYISIPALLLAFSVWMVWSMVVAKLPLIGFNYTTDQLFWLAALPGLSGATLRIFYSFMVPIFGGRLWTTLSTFSLLIPAFGIGYAVQNPETPYFIFLVLALLCGLGGGNFASSMSNISFFFPKASKGNAMALNAGLGNLGVSVMQFLIPIVITASVFGTMGGQPAVTGEGGELWLQNAGFIWVPFIIAAGVLAWFGMNDIADAKASFAEQSVIFQRKHNWLMCWLYTGTFGSFIGFSAGLPLLAKSQFPDVNVLKYVFLGPLVGAVSRAATGWVSDKWGGARVTLWVFLGMMLGVIGVMYFLGQKDFFGFLGMFVFMFFVTGVGNASTFQMIPVIMRQEVPRLMPELNATETTRQAEKESAAIVGFTSAIAAYGAFFIPKSFGSSIAATGTPVAALWGFLIFYASCAALTWFVYHLDRQVPYFEDYCRKYSDMPMLVRLVAKDGAYVPERMLRASDFKGSLGEKNNPDWKSVAIDDASGKVVAPLGTAGFRWGEKGKWNLEEKDGKGDDVKLRMTAILDDDHDDIVEVSFPYFGNRKHDHFKGTDHPDVLNRRVPVRSIALKDGKAIVATVFDLFCANYGLDRGLGGEHVSDNYSDNVPYTPAWAEKITGVPAEQIIATARGFAANAEQTNGKSMIILGAGLNHWYHMDMNYRGIINMLVMCGCIGQSGGGWCHYVGQEKLRPQTGWLPLAFGLDWNRPPRQMNSTSFFYAHSDQWRYETLDVKEILSPTAPDGDWSGTLIDYNVRAERMGWLPSAPQLKTNPLDVAKAIRVSGKAAKDYVAEGLQSGDLEMSCRDPDDPANWPRNMFVWRSNILGSSGKGHEYFLKHLLGTSHGVQGKDLGETGAQKPDEVNWHDEAPKGKLDLVVTLDFRMSTTCVYSDIVLPTASWYEKDDLNTSDMHPFIHPLSAAIDPVWETKSDWEIYKSLARKFSEIAPEVLGVEEDVVLTPILHDTPGELAQPFDVADWGRGEGKAIPGVTMPNVTVVERDYPGLYKRFTSLGPLLEKLGNGGKGINWNTDHEVELLRRLNGIVNDGGPTQGNAKIESAIDACEVLLMLAPETNGEVAVKAWEALSENTGRSHTHLARAKEDEKIRFRDVQVQPRKIISSPTWSGIESETVCYTAGYTNVHELIPWRTLTGRQQLYQDHPWMRAFGEGFCVYLGVMLYDADRIEEAASAADVEDLYQAQLDIFLDPNDPAVIEQARKDGVPDAWLEAARHSPVWKMAMEWKVAFPLHPEYRTLPMVWYVPPLSPISAAAGAGKIAMIDDMPDVRSLRIPLKYLANLLTAGKEEPVAACLDRMMAMRSYMRGKTVEGVIRTDIAARVGLSPSQIEEMYHVMAIANYEDRFVIPSGHREDAEDMFEERGSCGFSFGNGCSSGSSDANLFGAPARKKLQTPSEVM